MAHHGPQAGFLLNGGDGFGVGQAVGQGNLDLHVLAGLQALDGLRRMHLRGRAQDDGIELGQGQAVGEVGGDMGDAVLVGDFAGLLEIAADQRDDFDSVDVLDAVEVLDAEGACACERDFDGLLGHGFSWKQLRADGTGAEPGMDG